MTSEGDSESIRFMRGMCPQTHAHVKKTAHENCEKPAILKAIMRFATETRLAHRDGDRLRHHRRHQRDVSPVAEYQLKGVLALRQGHHGFGLAAAEMLVIIVGGDSLFHLFLSQGGSIDQQVMV